MAKVASWFSFITLAYLSASSALHVRACHSGNVTDALPALGGSLASLPGAALQTATVLFFALPKAYEKNQTEADKLIALATQEVNKLMDKLPKVQKIAKKAD